MAKKSDLKVSKLTKNLLRSSPRVSKERWERGVGTPDKPRKKVKGKKGTVVGGGIGKHYHRRLNPATPYGKQSEIVFKKKARGNGDHWVDDEGRFLTWEEYKKDVEIHGVDWELSERERKIYWKEYFKNKKKEKEEAKARWAAERDKKKNKK